METWMIYFGDHRCLSRSEESTVCKHAAMTAPRVHIHLLSPDREGHLWLPKYIFQVSVCLCLTFIQRSLNFFGKSFPFLFLFIVLSVLQYFPFHVSLIFIWLNYDVLLYAGSLKIWQWVRWCCRIWSRDRGFPCLKVSPSLSAVQLR